MNIAVINTNLAPGGKSVYLADTVSAFLVEGGHEATVFHLADLALPPCDGYLCYKDEKTISLAAELAGAEAILLVSPVYNYDLNSAAKNLIELTGSSWEGKAVGLVCLAGADRSYLSPLAFMNSLSVDYRCLVSPRYVYVTRADFEGGGVLPEGSGILKRLLFLAKELPVLAEAAAKIASFPRDV